MSETNRVDLKQDGANMYGCVPCPKCKSEYRWPTQAVHPTHPSSVLCDDCGHIEKAEFAADF